MLQPGDAYYRTGDLLRKDWLGFFYFVERIGDTFRWKGENVSTSEISRILVTHPDVNSACAYGVKLEGREGKVGMATITIHPGNPFDGGEIHAHLANSLPAYARPAFIRITETLKTNASFKVRLAEYAEEGFDPSRVSDPLYFRDDRQQTYRPLDAMNHQRVMDGEVRF